MKILPYISGICVLSSLSLGFSQSASAITTNLISTNIVYDFGTNASCAISSLSCTGGTFSPTLGSNVPGITFGNFSANGLGTLGVGFGFERGAGFNATDSLGLATINFPGTAVRDITKYFGFTVTLDPGATLNISAFNLSTGASGTKLDFSSVIGATETFLSTGQTSNGAYQLPAALYSFTTPTSYNNPSTSATLDVNFRIYGYSVNNANYYGIDSFSFTGSVTAVPFDFSPNLAIYALCGLYGANKLRNSLKKQKKE